MSDLIGVLRWASQMSGQAYPVEVLVTQDKIHATSCFVTPPGLQSETMAARDLPELPFCSFCLSRLRVEGKSFYAALQHSQHLKFLMEAMHNCRASLLRKSEVVKALTHPLKVGVVATGLSGNAIVFEKFKKEAEPFIVQAEQEALADDTELLEALIQRFVYDFDRGCAGAIWSREELSKPSMHLVSARANLWSEAPLNLLRKRYTLTGDVALVPRVVLEELNGRYNSLTLDSVQVPDAVPAATLEVAATLLNDSQSSLSAAEALQAALNLE